MGPGRYGGLGGAAIGEACSARRDEWRGKGRAVGEADGDEGVPPEGQEVGMPYFLRRV